MYRCVISLILSSDKLEGSFYLCKTVNEYIFVRNINKLIRS